MCVNNPILSAIVSSYRMTAKLHDWRRVEVVDQFDSTPDAILLFDGVVLLVLVIVDCCVLVFDSYETRNERWKQQTQQYLTVIRFICRFSLLNFRFQFIQLSYVWCIVQKQQTFHVEIVKTTLTQLEA